MATTIGMCGLEHATGTSTLVGPPDRDPLGGGAARVGLYQKGAAPPPGLKAAGPHCLGPVPNNYTDGGANRCTKCDMLGMKHATDMLNGAWGPTRAVGGRTHHPCSFQAPCCRSCSAHLGRTSAQSG